MWTQWLWSLGTHKYTLFDLSPELYGKRVAHIQNSYFSGTFMYLDQYYSCFLVILSSLHTCKTGTYLLSGEVGKRHWDRPLNNWDFLTAMQMSFDTEKWQIQTIFFSKFLRLSVVGCPLNRYSLSYLYIYLTAFILKRNLVQSCRDFLPGLNYKWK